MPEEMVENWEADDAAENWEADDAYGEAEDSAEATRSRYRPSPYRSAPRPAPFQPGRGVQGIVMRGPDGRSRNVPFPTKLATAAETNRGLATQEAGRRALEDRLDRLESRYRGQLKRESSATGAVTLALGGGLTVYGAIKAAQAVTQSRLGDWASRESTHIAAVVSATQLATSGAKLLINGRYHRSGVGMAADIFSAAQLTLFAIGALYTPGEQRVADDFNEASNNMANVPLGTAFVLRNTGHVFRVDMINDERLLRRIA
jgi:hypothetical protein